MNVFLCCVECCCLKCLLGMGRMPKLGVRRDYGELN